MDINFADVEKLIRLAENAHIGELEITSGQQTIRITCQAPDTLSSTSQNPAFSQSQPIPTITPSTPISQAQKTTQDSTDLGQSLATPTTTSQITSPMVGTFYRKSSPDTPAFVEEGATVTANQTLCIIEAMKIMHEVKAEKAGTIRKILVNDGEMVEYGQALFDIE